jgi:L-proline cis-4-hydroxylase
MESRIIGKLDFDAGRLARELARVSEWPLSDAYEEYTVGYWRSLVLINGTGQQSDATFRGYPNEPRLTPAGRSFVYIGELVRSHFDFARLKWSRLFVVRDGLLVPHRDYVEVAEPFIRLNIALKTTPDCLHSEEETVFLMRPGEVWQLAVRNVHAGSALNGSERISLCLDFAAQDSDAASLMLKRAGVSQPEIVGRSPLSDSQLNALNQLGGIINRDNIRDVIALLAKLHFRSEMTGTQVLDCLIRICRNSGDESLVDVAERYRRHCLGPRVLFEQFDFCK